MQPKPPRSPKTKKAPVSDLVWGVCTLLTFLYALYTTHVVFFAPLNGNYWPIVLMVTFWFLALMLATQAPDKG